MKVKLNRIVPQIVDVFNPCGELVGQANEYEFYDLRIQILREQEEGWSVRVQGELQLRFISLEGLPDVWVDLFDLHQKQLRDIIKLQMDNRKENNI